MTLVLWSLDVVCEISDNRAKEQSWTANRRNAYDTGSVGSDAVVTPGLASRLAKVIIKFQHEHRTRKRRWVPFRLAFKISGRKVQGLLHYQ